jgi:hypothetical protein
MRFGFDLDGCLDKPELRELARILFAAGHEIHIITAIFPDAPNQTHHVKHEKVNRLRIAHTKLHIVEAMPVTANHGLDYVRREIGRGKGSLCDKLGIDIMFDDSQLYIDMVNAVSNTVTAHVRG